MANFDYQWPYTRMTQLRAAGIYELDDLSVQIETLSRMIDAFAVQRIQSVAVICDYCAENHPSHQCAINFESMQYGGNFDEYPNSYAYPNNYHQDLGYHPDFSWSHKNQVQTFAPSQSYTPEFQGPASPHEEEGKLSLEEALAKFITATDKRMSDQDQLLNLVDLNIKSQAVSIQNLENQMGQLINAVNSSYHCVWPSDVVLETDGLPVPKLQPDMLIDDDSDMEENSGDQENTAVEDLALRSNANVPILLVPHAPSPPNFKDPGSFAIPCPIGSHVVSKALFDIGVNMNLEPWWDEKEIYEKLVEDPVVFKKLQCHSSFTNTMEQIPSYLQVLREILQEKSMLGDFRSMALTEAKPSNVSLLLMDGEFLNFRRGIG